MAAAQLIYGIPTTNPDLIYALGATTSDPIYYFKIRGTTVAIVPDTEVDVLKRISPVRRILTHSSYFRKIKSLKSVPGPADIIRLFLRENKIRHLVVHPHAQVALVDQLRKAGVRVTLGPFPFFPKRLVKTPAELRAITASQAVTFKAIARVESILRQSRIRGNRLYYKGGLVTSESLHALAKALLLENGYTWPNDLIIACGNDSTEPHNRGHGPIRPHASIIVDIFPLNPDTGMFGDATRTFCKGAASPQLKKMYLAVREAQEMAIRMIRPGRDGRVIHQAVQNFFNQAGFPTEMRKGRSVGFTHGTGHGLGIALHEEPVRISRTPWILKSGQVVTVEPGLYYPGIGAVRIEDVVAVTSTGCKVLSSYPKKLEV
jgi:Xaa-Pro aminopeptidase